SVSHSVHGPASPELRTVGRARGGLETTGYGGAMDRETAQDWLIRYVAAWMSYDPADIAALFSEDVAYRYHPYDEPIVGRDAVVASWLGEDTTGNASTRDAPGTYDAEYAPVAV